MRMALMTSSSRSNRKAEAHCVARTSRMVLQMDETVQVMTDDCMTCWSGLQKQSVCNQPRQEDKSPTYDMQCQIPKQSKTYVFNLWRMKRPAPSIHFMLKCELEMLTVTNSSSGLIICLSNQHLTNIAYFCPCSARSRERFVVINSKHSEHIRTWERTPPARFIRN